MEADFKKTCYENNPSFRVHHVWGYNILDAYHADSHYDSAYTIAYFKKGRGGIQIEGNHYTICDGDIVIVNHDELHSVNIDRDYFTERITIYPNESILTNFSESVPSFFDAFRKRNRGQENHISASVAKKHSLDKLIEEALYLASSSDKESDVLAVCKIMEILSVLGKIVCPKLSKQAPSNTSNSIINEIIKYIGMHFSEDISCDSIAKHFHMSTCHLSRIFKEFVGVSLWEYVIKKRIFLFNELVRKNESIEEACFLAGFNNYSNFYRLYKKHTGISPMEFKKKIAKSL